jgi:hypothetical protein
MNMLDITSYYQVMLKGAVIAGIHLDGLLLPKAQARNRLIVSVSTRGGSKC